jgi:hypothetical protein
MTKTIYASGKNKSLAFQKLIQCFSAFTKIPVNYIEIFNITRHNSKTGFFSKLMSSGDEYRLDFILHGERYYQNITVENYTNYIVASVTNPFYISLVDIIKNKDPITPDIPYNGNDSSPKPDTPNEYVTPQ